MQQGEARAVHAELGMPIRQCKDTRRDAMARGLRELTPRGLANAPRFAGDTLVT
jgi:hypothetical protein